MLRFGGLLFLALAPGGCAGKVAALASPPYSKQIRSLPATAPTLRPPTVAALAPNARASDYLALGLSLYQADQRHDAASAFQLALQTGNLNNQGRALAYWHLFLADRDGNLQGPGADALDSFVTVSRDLLDECECRAEEDCADVKEFVDGFNLSDRLLLAELVLDALWARRDPGFGRTPDRPVQVRDAEAERLFVQLFRPCAQTDAAPAVEFSASPHPRLGHIDHAQISCPNAGQPLSFYFSTKN